MQLAKRSLPKTSGRWSNQWRMKWRLTSSPNSNNAHSKQVLIRTEDKQRHSLSFSAKRSCNAGATGDRGHAFNFRLFGFTLSRQLFGMFESLALCFAYLCSASLNMTMPRQATTEHA